MSGRYLLVVLATLLHVYATPAIGNETMPSLDPADLEWRTVNDNVMGGRSSGGYRFDAGVLVFSGSTNTRGGGFSSIRSAAQPLKLDRADSLVLRLRGDGRTYTLRLETSRAGSGWGRRVTYWAQFGTRVSADWEEVHIPFSAFRPVWRGRRLDGPALDRSRIDSLGLMIYDQRDGPFRLEVESITASVDPGIPDAGNVSQTAQIRRG